MPRASKCLHGGEICWPSCCRRPRGSRSSFGKVVMPGRPGRSIKNASSYSMAECGTFNAVVRSGKPMPRSPAGIGGVAGAIDGSPKRPRRPGHDRQRRRRGQPQRPLVDRRAHDDARFRRSDRRDTRRALLPPKFHSFSLTVIQLSLQVVVAGRLSLRSMQTVVSFRQACMNHFEASGIVGCDDTILWRTADEYQKDRVFPPGLR